MRPVTLTLDGFASFRTPTTIDFTGVDYFALVGPTGSGKSTVIDGIVFALYGTAPRWGHATAIRHALAPTSLRARVGLVFETGGQRYQVAREVRRKGATPSQTQASLERILPEGVVEALASDPGAVTQAVGELLGIGLEEFCKAVVLPQGQFAAFLTATAKERQDILFTLLGAQVYTEVQQAATRRRQQALDTLHGLEGQLLQLEWASPQALAASNQRITGLGELRIQVEAGYSRWRQHTQAVSQAGTELAQATERLALLKDIVVPDGVRDLRAEGDRTRAALLAAQQRAAGASNAYQEARAALAGAAPSEKLHGDLARWARHDALSTQAGELATAHEASLDSQELAAVALASAKRQLQTARTGLDAVGGQERDAQAKVVLLAERQALVSRVVEPADLASLAEGLQAVAGALGVSNQAAVDAELALGQARATLVEAGDEVALHQQRELARRAEGIQADLAEATAIAAAAHSSDNTARDGLQQALESEAQARTALEQARHRHAAAGLREALVPGEDCPVCAQPVVNLPAAERPGELTEAEAQFDQASGALAAAQAAAHRSSAQLASATEKVRGLQAQWESLAAQLGLLEGLQPATVRAGLDAALRVIEQAKVTLEQAEQTLRAAREDQQGALAAHELATARASSAATALSDAREKVAALEPPSLVGLDVSAGWQRLTTWATACLTDLSEALRGAEQQAVALAAERQAGEAGLAAAHARFDEAEQTERSALAESARLSARLGSVQEEQGHLAAALAKALDRAAIERALAEREELVAAEQAAYGQVDVTTAQIKACEAAVALADQRAQAAVQELRDLVAQVAPLGAPPVSESDLAGAWETLLAWAESAIGAATAEIGKASAATAAARQAAQSAQTELAELMAPEGLSAPHPERSLGAVEVALGQALSESERLSAALAQRVEIEGQRERAAKLERVAAQLAASLRADRFLRWLAEAALDLLVASASQVLLELSGGQFGLTHDGKEFCVVDHADAEAERSVRTLSGGETFQASLALALALSGELSGLASGTTTLDSIFLDEGFGTLDAESLEVVAGTLEKLAQGERMVGIVTHVASLAERVPTRFQVSRGPRTSTVERHG